MMNLRLLFGASACLPAMLWAATTAPLAPVPATPPGSAVGAMSTEAVAARKRQADAVRRKELEALRAAPPVNPAAVFAGKLTNVAGKPVAVENLKSARYVLLYFSARWSPACQKFSPAFTAFAKAHEDDPNLAIVFISHDDDDKARRSHMREAGMTCGGFIPQNILEKRHAKLGTPLGPSDLAQLDAGVRGLPHVRVLKAGRIAFDSVTESGEDFSPEQVLRQLGAALAGDRAGKR